MHIALWKLKYLENIKLFYEAFVTYC